MTISPTFTFLYPLFLALLTYLVDLKLLTQISSPKKNTYRMIFLIGMSFVFMIFIRKTGIMWMRAD